MSGCAVTENGDAHLASAVAPLLLIGNISGWVDTPNVVTIAISGDVLIKAARECCVVSIITVFAAPVVATERTVVGEKVTIIIEDWLVISDVADVREPIAFVEFVVGEVVLFLELSDLHFKLKLAQTSALLLSALRQRVDSASLSRCGIAHANDVTDNIGSVLFLQHFDEAGAVPSDEVAAGPIVGGWEEAADLGDGLGD